MTLTIRPWAACMLLWPLLAATAEATGNTAQPATNSLLALALLRATTKAAAALLLLTLLAGLAGTMWGMMRARHSAGEALRAAQAEHPARGGLMDW